MGSAVKRRACALALLAMAAVSPIAGAGGASAAEAPGFRLVAHVNRERPADAMCRHSLERTVCTVPKGDESCTFTFAHPGPDAAELVPGGQFALRIDGSYACTYPAGPPPSGRPSWGYELSIKVGGFTWHVGGTPNAGWNGFGQCRTFLGASGGPYVSEPSVSLGCMIGVPPRFPGGGPYSITINAGDSWAATWEVVVQ